MSLPENRKATCRSIFITILCACGLFILTSFSGENSLLETSYVAHQYQRAPPAYAMKYEDASHQLPDRTSWIISSINNSVAPHELPQALRSVTRVHHQHLMQEHGVNAAGTVTPVTTNSGSKHHANESAKCEPIQQIVFLKTHKTASTTVASVFERYGYYRNLTFAIGRKHVLSFQNKFSRKNLMKFPKMAGKTYNILTNHARYNREEMDAVVPNSVYITILRHPEDQIDSAFGYFEMYRGMQLGKEKNPLKTFMDNPMKYYKKHKYHMWQLSRNGMLYDLGLDHKFDEDERKINEKILELDNEFDLVMITEYIDESLILLKKLLCWEYKDIVYLSSGIRSQSHRYEKDESLREKIRQWSSGDMALYKHFNDTLWKKIGDYGPSFEEDLKYFRELNKSVFETCVDPNKINRHDRREDILTLKNESEWCKSVIRADMGYTKMIRKSMVDRFGAPPLTKRVAEFLGYLLGIS